MPYYLVEGNDVTWFVATTGIRARLIEEHRLGDFIEAQSGGGVGLEIAPGRATILGSILQDALDELGRIGTEHRWIEVEQAKECMVWKDVSEVKDIAEQVAREKWEKPK